MDSLLQRISQRQQNQFLDIKNLLIGLIKESAN